MIFMMLSSWQSHCESSPSSFYECRLSAEVSANPQTKPTDSDWESARKKWQLPSTSTIAILILLSQRLEGGRLSRPRHCSKGVQPVPKAVYRSGCRDKHNCLQWVSNLGSLIPQSGMLPLGHCDTAMGTFAPTPPLPSKATKSILK